MKARGDGPVVIGWISGGTPTAGFTASLAALTAITPQYGVELIGAIPKVSGPRIAAARNNLVESFLSTPGEWLFMVDDDMTFEPDALVRLLDVAKENDVKVVGGFAYAAGRDGYFSTIWTLDEDRNPVRVDDYPANQIIRVVGTGAACLLVHRSVFEKIREQYGNTPWIWFQETSLRGHTVGEDFTFCIRVGEAGFPILVDTGNEFGHDKTVNINREFVEHWRRGHRVLVTGTGRCGTGYVSRVFSRAAIPATHEGVYAPERGEWTTQRVESSWLAAPHLPFDGYTVQLVRNPLDVVNSLVGIGFFSDPTHKAYVDYAREHVELDGTEVEQAMQFYVAWNELIEPYADMRLQVEELTADDFSNMAYKTGAKHSPVDFREALAAVSTEYNHRKRAELTWDDLPAGEAKDALIAKGKEYGYD